MPADRDHPARPAAPPAAGSPRVDDLTWLAYRAAGALGEAFNKVSRDAGLADLRDWLVLALISGDGTQRTQLDIATQLGIDKSTLVPLLDRLERDGLIIRSTSERDRRVRIPQATPAGIKVVKQVAIARDAARIADQVVKSSGEQARYLARQVLLLLIVLAIVVLGLPFAAGYLVGRAQSGRIAGGSR